ARRDDKAAASNKRRPIRRAPEMQSSRSSAQARPRLPRYSFFDVNDSFYLLGHAQLCAPRAGIRALFFIGRLHRFRRNQFKIVIGIALWLWPFRLIEPFPAMIAKKVLHDPIL